VYSAVLSVIIVVVVDIVDIIVDAVSFIIIDLVWLNEGAYKIAGTAIAAATTSARMIPIMTTATMRPVTPPAAPPAAAPAAAPPALQTDHDHTRDTPSVA